MLWRSRFLTGVFNEELGVKDVTWLSPGGEEMASENWHDPHARCLRVLLDGRAQPTGIRRRGTDVTLLLIFNASHKAVRFQLPTTVGRGGWTLLAHTEQDTNAGDTCLAFGADYQAAAGSVILFELK
jgi:glycogen operon protein